MNTARADSVESKQLRQFTKDEILAMKPSQELDFIIHLNFFVGTFLWESGYHRYSSDLNAAFMLTRKVPFWRMQIVYDTAFKVNFTCRTPNRDIKLKTYTEAEAICKAALLSIGTTE